MKKHLPFAALLVFAFATFCFAQPQPAASPSASPKPKPKMTKAQILKKLSANETALWNAWKSKDAKPFQMWLSADSVMVGETGVAGKGDVTKMMESMPCDVKSFTEGTCGGTAIPTVWASSVWVNRGGKWMAFAHQETAVKP